jgi:hypothetical protein
VLVPVHVLAPPGIQLCRSQAVFLRANFSCSRTSFPRELERPVGSSARAQGSAARIPSGAQLVSAFGSARELGWVLKISSFAASFILLPFVNFCFPEFVRVIIESGFFLEPSIPRLEFFQFLIVLS